MIERLIFFVLSCVAENHLRIQIGNRALPITAEAVHQVFGLPVSGQSLPNYNAAEKRASRVELRKLCDAKGLESLFRRRGGNYVGLGVSEVPRWFIEHYANVKEAGVDNWTVQSFLMHCIQCTAIFHRQRQNGRSGLPYVCRLRCFTKN
jgi:hypothetical protein